MTFSEMVTATPTLYPEQIDDALQGTIFDWFQYRNVVDNNKFPSFFKRILNRDYDRYTQLLRVQPGIAEYDWFVENYLERQTTGTTTDKQTNENSVTGSSESTRTDNLTEGVQRATHNSVTNGGTDIVDTSSKNEGSSNVTNSGTDTVTNTGENTTTNSGTDTTTSTNTNTVDRDTTGSRTYAGTETNTRTGNETDTRAISKGAVSTTRTMENNQTKRTQTTNTGTETGSTDSGTATAAKQGPMDAGVTSIGAVSDSSAGTVTNDFNGHASSIGQSRVHEARSSSTDSSNVVNESWSGNPDSESTNTAATEDTDNGTHTYNNVADVRSFTNRADNDTGTEDTTTTDNGSVSVAHGLKTVGETTGKQVTEHGLATSTTATTEQTDKTTTTFGKTETGDATDNYTKTNGGTVGTTGSTTSTGNGTTEKNGTSDIRERISGRQKAPSELLPGIVAFIEQSNAWEWLMPRLEVCFLSCYDV